MPPDVAELAAVYRAWFTTAARRRAEQVIELDDLCPGAFAVLDPQFPLSYDSNRVVLPTVPDGLELADVLVAVEETLAGLDHRELSVYDAVPPEWDQAMAARNVAVQRVIGMVRPLPDPDGADPVPPPVDGVEVELLTEAEVAPFVAAQWREDRPGFDDETVRQLVERRVHKTRAGQVRLLAVRIPDDAVALEPALASAAAGLAAQLDLVIGDTEVQGRQVRVAELDAVSTLSPWRRRRYGDALVVAALRAAADAGARAVVLEALVEDWPREWYARRGFAEVSSSTGYSWQPL